ncbi:MAG: glycosyltransferase family 1 protein [Acidobacteriota bacterium]|nr:glycosyltransferase family 1 protein [Acidobacteriota bacterium]
MFQRPQHLMSRFARQRRVYFIEEPVFERACEKPGMRLRKCEKTGVKVATPEFPEHFDRAQLTREVSRSVSKLLRSEKINEYIAWYYTPMALEISKDLRPKATVYDCMDELSLFHNAPPELTQNERKLFGVCDLVFTGGESLFESKRRQHDHVYAFPSSVDCDHFAQARVLGDTAEDQKTLPRPRLGYAGVIDERIDVKLIGELAERRPEWQFVMIGPVVKIDPATLPNKPNIHWLGMKDYADLPQYLAGWDVALMPFAMNDSTKFISPTKTPEYLAAGLPVVSTPIRDVERHYGELGMVRIEGTTEGFLAAAEQALTYEMGFKWRERVDAFLMTMSWDRTWNAMNNLIEESIAARTRAAEQPAVMAASHTPAALV